MDKIKNNLMSVICAASAILGLITFLVLNNTAPDEAENMILVVVLAALVVVFSGLSIFKDFFHAVSLIAFILATVLFFVFIAGRVSYFAFWASGDIKGTGLSPFFITTTLLLLASLISGAAALFTNNTGKIK